MSNPRAPEAAAPLLDFWFGAACESPEACVARRALWFAPDDAFDRALRARFDDLPERAREGALDGWRSSPCGALALVIALDQLPRNLNRDSARAFACDGHALRAASEAIGAGFDRLLHPVESAFLYLPFEHSESRADQARCVSLFAGLAGRAPEGWRAVVDDFAAYAESHREVVERFGRFPHRNAVLGRADTADETRYLADGGGFGRKEVEAD